MAFDGLTTKAIADELQNLAGARIDKVFQPNKNEILLGLYLDGKNYALDICIDSGNYRINLTTHSKQNPQVAPNFCMLLRKHLIGLQFKNVITFGLERLVVLDIEGFDDFEDIVSKKLIIELMGKHSNVILVDEANIIIDSLRHIKADDEINRNILPHTKYQFPTTNKINILEINNCEDFINKLETASNNSYLSTALNNTNNDLSKIAVNNSLPSLVCDTYNGISKLFVEQTLLKSSITNKTVDLVLKDLYEYIYKILNESTSLKFEIVETPVRNKIKKDYYLTLGNTTSTPFSLNFFIDDFYFEKENGENFKNYRDTILKLILSVLKKYNTRLVHIDDKLKECENMEIYKLYGELITANLYKIDNKNLEFVELENYYDNNSLIKIPLDKKYLPNENAKRFYKKYNKLKNTLEIVGKQKEDTIKELDYLESIVYELEEATSLNEVTEVFEEISESEFFKDYISKKQNKSKVKKSKLTKNKEVSFNPIKYTVDGYTIFVGKNNKENDYLTLKFANKTDLWFHTKDIHGSHVILKLNENMKPTEDILYKCAELASKHSKAKNSSNVPVDYCPVKYVKKPNGAKPGMVIYTNNKTIYVK